MTVIEAIKGAEEALFNKNIPDYKFDAKVIIKESLGCSDAEVIARYNEEMPKKALKKFKSMLRARLTKKPMAYITKRQGFYGHEFNVGKGVLIPRSDTEILVENAIKKYKELNNNDEVKSDEIIIDMCTGSGCIALSLAKELPLATIYGVDISNKAIRYAKRNKEELEADNCIILKSNLFDYFEDKKRNDFFEGKVSMIVSNPPYIRTEVYKKLDKSVKKYEPRLALDGGLSGLDYYKRILSTGSRLLKKGGIIAFEIDDYFKLINDLKECFEYYKFSDIRIIKDYNGKDRVMIGVLH